MNDEKLGRARALITRRRDHLKETMNWAGLGLTMLICAAARTRADGGQRAATAVALVTNGSVTSVTVTDGGAGYTASPKVTSIGGGGGGAIASAQITNGAVASITVVEPGSGYTNAPIVAVDPPASQIASSYLSENLVPRLTITGQPYSVQQLQYTAYLGRTNQWLALTNIVLGTNPVVFVDASVPPGGTRFYRVETLTAQGPDPAKWAWINPGTFTMGSPDTEYDRSPDESPQTQVTFTYGFWMKRVELPQGEYTALVGTNYSYFLGDTNQPVENVSWNDATNYCGLLTAQERAAGRLPAGYVYRLPSEAEWEYTTRAGTTTRFFFGDDHNYTVITNYAWVTNSSGYDGGTTHEGAEKQPNPWGVYDMQGNVWEWCADYYAPYLGGSITNPAGPAIGTNRVMRGASFRYPGGDARSAARNFNAPDFFSEGIGIRVVLGPSLQP